MHPAKFETIPIEFIYYAEYSILSYSLYTMPNTVFLYSMYVCALGDWAPIMHAGHNLDHGHHQGHRQ